MVSVKITGMEDEKAERLAKLLEKLVEHGEELEDVLETLARMRETGMLAAVKALADSFEEGFNYLMRPEFMASIGNMMMLLYSSAS